ncbi:MAG: LysR family transcriptional regulator [Leucothrix sp.]
MAELKWLEDLVVLLEEKSFTKAAERRHVTQPAFSRRIRLLEDWLSTPIVDRSRKPIGIISSFIEREDEVRELINHFYQLRSRFQDDSLGRQHTVFAVQHTLAVSRFPSLLQFIKHKLPHTSYRIQTANNDECERLFLKEAQFMLVYETPHNAFALSTDYASQLSLPSDHLIPVATPETCRQIRTNLKDDGIPLLTYPKGGFMADALMANCLPSVMQSYPINVICETAFSISLKEMVLSGMGVAWLPESLIKDDLSSGRVTSLAEKLGTCELPVSLYYRQGSGAGKIFELLDQS